MNGSVVVPRISVVVAACFWLAGCASESLTTAFPVPDQIRQTSAINSANLTLEIRINNGSPRVFSGQGLDDSWVVPLSAPANATNTITVSWFENFQNERLLLASQTSSFTTTDAATSVTLDGNYTVSGNGYDFDSDGVSNLAERNANTDPIVADSGSFSVNEPETIALDAACFLMGSAEDETGRSSSEMQHQVCVNAFSIGKYEVTFEQYDQFANLTSRAKPSDSGWGRGAMPVINVSQADATDYAAWLSEQTGKNYRLPTEAEWEYAARAGSVTPFNTGNIITASQANFNASVSFNGSPIGAKPDRSVPVGSYTPNAWGIYDMHGNQSEWTCSTFSFLYTGAELSCDPFPENSTYARRGGSWSTPAEQLRSAARARDTRDRAYFYVGFRVALVP